MSFFAIWMFVGSARNECGYSACGFEPNVFVACIGSPKPRQRVIAVFSVSWYFAIAIAEVMYKNCCYGAAT